MKRFAWVWTAVMVISLSVASGASTPGRPYSFGHNAYGKLGYGYADTNAHPTPAEVTNLSRIVGVSAGDHHSLAVKEDGTVWVWGCNGTGQCDYTFIDRWSPVQFYPLTGVVAVEAGMGYSMALKADGTVWTWGTWDWGVLGQGNTWNIPGQVVGLEGVVGIAAGVVHNLAVKSDGTVWAWGTNTNGQLGDDTIEDRNAPVQVQGLTDAVSVSAGYMHSLALMRNGTVWAWGDNSHGELGDGTTLERHTPVQVAGLSDVESISAGALFSLAVKSDGTVWAWGLGSSLGIGATDDCLTPVQITVLTGVSSISSGGYPHPFFCLALCKDGTVYTWGLNSRGQFGDGTTIGSDVPVKNNLLSDVVSVSAGFIHSLVVVEAKPVSVRFSISPTGGEDGRLLLPQPVVEVVDSGGDRVDTFDGTVSIAIKAGTGDPSAQLLGTTSLQAVDGVAVFTDLAIDLAGTGYVLTASSPGLLDGDTAPFDVVKTARCLAFDIQPGQGREGVVLGTQPVVSARFSDGTKAEYYTGQVTISIIPGSGTPGAVLNGTTIVNCAEGIATFVDLSIDKWGTGYVLMATSTGLTSAFSAAFDVAPVAKYLTFTQQPQQAIAGTRFVKQPTVCVMGSDSKPIIYDGPITLSIKPGTGTEGAVLNGTTTVNCVEYYAIFTDLSIDKAGHDYVLTATNPALMSVDSSPFNVGPAATKLAFDVQPGSAREGVVLGAQPVISAKYSDGTTATYFNGPVTVSIKPGTGASGALLNGTTTVNCVDGIATFTNLSIDKWGTGYILTVTSPGLTSADSAAFDVAPVAKYLVFTISPFYPMAGSRFQEVPTVYVMGSDDRAINYDGPITLSIKPGTGTEGAVLNGTTTVNCVEYYAIFTDLSIDKAGHNYVLTATSPGLIPGDSEAFDVAEAASSLVFEVQPGRWCESGLGTQPIVAAKFNDGTTANYFSGPVTISIKPGSGTPGAVLGGNRTKNCINGRAAYENLSIDKAGAGYVLTASSPGLASGDSQPFDVVTRYTVYAWGLNEYGQLGDGTVDERHTPTALAGLYDVISVDGGTTHSLTATEDGSVWGWGNNYYGQLGDGSTTDSLIPVQISGLAGVRQVSAGRGHSLALMENGTVWAWGWNSRGQLGDGTQTWRSTPVQVPDLTDIKAVSAGYYHSLALKNDGTVWAWGGNTSGQLGDGTWSMRKSPVRVLYLSDVKAVSAGSFHSLALKEDGSVWAWGLNSSGQLGINTTESSPDPVQVTALNEVAAVAAGGFHSLAVKSDGTVLAFGSDGLAPTEDLTPVAVAGLTGVISATAGESSSFVMCDDRSLWAWGSNYSGTLGDGTTEERHTPVRVLCPAGIIAIGAGDFHGLAVVSSVLTHPYAVEEAREALSIAGGLSAADRMRFDRLNAAFTGPSAGLIDIIDVARIARKVAGLESNP
jgi:alpha-tubulin suppressor-like RCC1 family protein